MKQEEKGQGGQNQDVTFSVKRTSINEYDFFISEGVGEERGSEESTIADEKGDETDKRSPFFLPK